MNIEVFLLNVEFLQNQDVFATKLRHVSKERRDKINRLKNQADKYRSLGAGLLLERVLKEHFIDPNDLVEGDYGKPEVPGSDFHFNLSHSGDYVALVIGKCPVGIDIQEHRKFKNDIPKRFFCQEEAAHIGKKKTEEEKQNLFFRYWSAKESFVKLTGEGMKRDFHSFFVDLKNDRILSKDKEEQLAYLMEYPCLEDYTIMVSSEDKPDNRLFKSIYYKL